MDPGTGMHKPMEGTGRHKNDLVFGTILVLMGLIGAVVIAAAFISAGDTGAQGRYIWPGSMDGGAPRFYEPERSPEDFTSLGEQIYYTGRGENGRIIPRADGIMYADACVDCHGRDGRGGTVRIMMGRFDAPDIRWEVLTEAHDDHPPYDLESFARALRESEKPGGGSLDRVMPRWGMTDEEIEALAEYLEEL